MTTLCVILALAWLITLYVAIAKHDRIRQLERQLSDATWRHLQARQSVSRLSARQKAHLAAVDAIKADMAYMQSRCCHMAVRAWRRRRERAYRTLSWRVAKKYPAG